MTARFRTICLALLGCAVALQLGPLLWTAQAHDAEPAAQLNWHTGNPNTWAAPGHISAEAEPTDVERKPVPLPTCLAATLFDLQLYVGASVGFATADAQSAASPPSGTLFAQHCLLTV